MIGICFLSLYIPPYVVPVHDTVADVAPQGEPLTALDLRLIVIVLSAELFVKAWDPMVVIDDSIDIDVNDEQ